MWRRRKARRDGGLEAALRGYKPDAPDHLVERLARRVAADQPAARRGREWSRVAFAAAVSVFILGTFASFGGLSYAASGATDSYSVVKQVVVQHKLKVSVHKSSASDQYPSSPKHSVLRPPSVHNSTHKVKAKHAALGAQAVQGDTLPFTGFSLIATAGVGFALIGSGIALRRRERRRS
jgi:hypothetical protein